MRGLLLSTTTLLVACALGACSAADSGSSQNSAAPPAANSAHSATVSASPANSAVNTNSATTADNNGNTLPVASAHGGGLTGAPPLRPGSGAGAGSTNGGGAAEKPDIDTKELDAKIEKAEAKARQTGAGEADRRAAARAYIDRGYLYYSAQNPKLYKFALGDFRRSLRYQPDNADTRAIIDQIEGIYRQMGRPIPSNGLEQ